MVRVGTLREAQAKLRDSLVKELEIKHAGLHAHYHKIGAEGAKQFAQALKHNTTLITLNLSDNNIGAEGARHIADALRHIADALQQNTLTTLDLSDNNIGAEGVRHIVDLLNNNTTLKKINLSGNNIGVEGAKHIAEALKRNTTLKTLDLSLNEIGVEGAKYIAHVLKQNKTLTTLNLQRNEIGAEGANCIAEALEDNTTLITLDLWGSKTGAEGAKHIAEALKHNPTLLTLNLGLNQIGIEGVEHIVKALKLNTTLITLDLDFNEIGAEGAKHIAEALKHNRTLTTLNFGWNNIGVDGAKYIAEGLEQNKTLTKLILWNNSIGAEGAKHIAEGLKHNKTLITLILWGNDINVEGAKHIAEALNQNTTLATLDLGINGISFEEAEYIAEALKHNTTLTTFDLGNDVGQEGTKLGQIMTRNNKMAQVSRERGYSLFHAACLVGDADLVSWLIDSGANVNSNAGKDIWTPLQIASSQGKTEIVTVLIEKGKLCTREGNSLLHLATKDNHPQMVLWLIENGADVHCVNRQGQTASEIAENEAIQQILRVAESNPVSILKRVAYVRKNRLTTFGVLPDASLNTLLQKLQAIDCNQLVVPGLDELAMTESLKLRLLDAQEQLRKTGNDAVPEAVQARNQLRLDLARSIQEVQATISSDATNACIALLQSWLESLKDDPSLVNFDEIREANDLGGILKNAIDASLTWIENSKGDVQQQIIKSDAIIEELSKLLEEASKCLLQDQPALPWTKNFASATAAVKKALTLEQSVSVVPQDVANSLKRAALLVIATIEDLFRQFASVQAAVNDFLPWLHDAQPWLGVDASPTELLEEIDAAQTELVNSRERIGLHDVQYTAAQKRRTASRDQLQQMADTMTHHKQTVSSALNRLHAAQMAAIVTFSAHFPELLSHELVSEFARLDGLKLSSASFTDFMLVDTIRARHKVHKAIDFEGNFCALKEYPPLNQNDKESMREARILHRLNHPAVASVIAVFFDNSFYLQMPWYDQGTLSEWSSANPRPSSQQLQQVLREVLSAIDYIHINKVIHGDIKPQNIMMTTRQGRTLPQPVLADFDLAKQMDGPSVSKSSHAAGTFGFIAPELLKGQRRSYASDMYAFGITMTVVLSPETNMDNSSLPTYTTRVITAFMTMDSPSLPAYANPVLISVVSRLCSPDPRQRPTARQVQMEAYFAEALHDVDYDRRQLPVYWDSPTPDQANRIVDVTASLGDKIQALMTSTCKSEHIGRGRDSDGLTHTGFAVARVDRVENGLMWRAYANRKIHIREAAQKASFTDQLVTIGALATTEFASQTPGGLDENANEIYGFHGAPANIIDIIKSTGMDERVTSSGLFGAGLYFAENSSKSDEYVRPDSNGLCYMVLARVCMGRVKETQQALAGANNAWRRPPCINGCLLNTACGHVRYDSVRADTGGILQVHREFVVYDRSQVYPEYIISFYRV